MLQDVLGSGAYGELHVAVTILLQGGLCPQRNLTSCHTFCLTPLRDRVESMKWDKKQDKK